MAQEKRSLLVRNPAERAELPPSKAQIYTTSSFLCVPILLRGKLLGVINVGEKENQQAFDEKELRFVETVADQIAPVIDHAVALHSLRAQCRTTLEALVRTFEGKNLCFAGHSERVADHARSLARAADATAEEIEMIHYAGQTVDIGKLAIDERVLAKEGELSAAERQAMCEHPALGESAIQELTFLSAAMPLIRHHHERFDGTGYPGGLKGDKIPLLARMLTIADAFDAMTSDRPYRKAIAAKPAADEILAERGLQFDPELATIFYSCIISPEN